VAEGQPAMVTIDRLPGHAMEATVSRIALIGENYRGDVVYEVVVRWAETQRIEALRWGMTAVVTIEVA
jgi:hypothetical protein